MPILIPGVGAQGGDVAEAARAGADGNGRGMLISSSRGITYASDDPKEYPRYAKVACDSLRREINIALETPAGSTE
jgi:orotidine-5'-phosphate decarboxylase